MQGQYEKDEGLVSVIMPACDAGNFIGDSIQSVINQTYANWELIVVDDCSVDKTVEIVRRYMIEDGRIRLLSGECRQGAALSRNWAISEARGRWVAFLDSDDLWDREKLEFQIDDMVSRGCAFSYTPYREISEDGIWNGNVCLGPNRITKLLMSCFCWPGCLTVVYDRLRMGIIEIPSLAKHNDYAMWLNLIKRADCVLCSRVLASYRLRSKSVSHGSSVFNQLHDMYLVWRRSEGKSVLCALIHTFVNGVFWFVKKIKYVRKEYR